MAPTVLPAVAGEIAAVVLAARQIAPAKSAEGLLPSKAAKPFLFCYVKAARVSNLTVKYWLNAYLTRRHLMDDLLDF